MSKVTKVLLWVFLIWIGLPLFIIWVLTLQEKINRPYLVRDLPSDLELGNQELQQRMDRTFPVGTANAAVVEALSQAGFSLSKSNTPFEKSAMYTESGFVCDVAWKVYWTVDERNQLADIESHYQAACL